MLNIQTLKTNRITQTKLNVLVIPVTGKAVLKSLMQSALKDTLQHHINHADSMDQAGSSVLFYPQGDTLTERILLVQLGKNKSANASSAATLAKALRPHANRQETVGIVLPSGVEKAAAAAVLHALYQQRFQFHEHRSTVEDKDKHKLTNVILFSDKKIDTEIQEEIVVGEAIAHLKTLAHRPANALTPTILATAAEQIGKQNKFSVQSLDEAAMAKLGMGGILSVSKGSDEEARLIVMDYNPKAKYTVALVGKGITFDSGGISIKPAKDMHEMKFDMIGGATVLALMQIVSSLKLPLHIVGIIAASENLPSGKATKPGDVVTMYSGKTVEVLNTDAEGRMVLADGLTYAQKHFKPNVIIDIATLTGAVVIALGNKISGALGNNHRTNIAFAEAAKASNEDIHFLPLYTGYADEIKSSVADLANIGKQRVDALIGGLFLSQFIEKQTPWIHLDIAGTAWNNEGPTGVMVNTVLTYLKKLPKK